MTPVVSALETVYVSISSAVVSLPSVLSPVRSWIDGRRFAMLPLQLTEILTGMTLPFWTVLTYGAASTGGAKLALYTFTLSLLTAADVPPSLSVAFALTLCEPQVEKLVEKGLEPAA